MADGSQERSYPKPVVAWSMVILLGVAYIFSWIDRYVLGLLVEPIKADLGFTDAQMGLLMGVAFGLLYATIGVPIGWLADRYRRTWIVAAGVLIWSAATALTGLAKGFWHVFIARMSVAAGEATLSPCAMSMISDSFPPAQRGKPIAVYTAALSLGAGFASLITAVVLAWAETLSGVELPGIGPLQPWQWVFIVVGLPGLFLAVAFLFMPEPPRIEGAVKDKAESGGTAEMFRFIGSRSLAYFSVVAMAAAMIITAYSQGWMAAGFNRTFGWEASKYATWNGVTLLAFGPPSVFLAGFLSDKLYAMGRKDGPYLIMIIGLTILIPSGCAVMLMPSPELGFVMIAISTIGIALVSAVGPTALVNIIPGAIRGQTVALYYMFVSLTGLFIGQYIVGVMSDKVFGNENLGYAIAVIPIVCGIPALLLGLIGRKAYLRALEQNAAENA